MKYKIIFVDIDWTIFDHSFSPSRFDMDSIEALNEAHSKGVLVFICTARPYHSIVQTSILEYLKPDGIICSNGGQIIYQDKIIHRTKVPTEEFEKLCELAFKYGGNVEGIRIYDSFLINENYDDIAELLKTYPGEIPHIEDYHDQDVIGAGLYIKEEYDEIFKKELPNLGYFYRFHPNGVDISSEIHDKGKSVKFVLDYLKIKKEESISFGDDYQDITMFNETGFSVALDNAKEEVKKAAKYITKSVTNHGVAFALKEVIK